MSFPVAQSKPVRFRPLRRVKENLVTIDKKWVLTAPSVIYSLKTIILTQIDAKTKRR